MTRLFYPSFGVIIVDRGLSLFTQQQSATQPQLFPHNQSPALYTAMSSPPQQQRRMDGSSAPGTPSRGQANSQVPRSSPMQMETGADDQPRTEESQASQTSLQVPAQVTPRGNRASQHQDTSQNPPTSSPLFFRSSPANSASLNGVTANPIDASSPLGQASSDGGATPKASGQTIGGACGF